MRQPVRWMVWLSKWFKSNTDPNWISFFFGMKLGISVQWFFFSTSFREYGDSPASIMMVLFIFMLSPNHVIMVVLVILILSSYHDGLCYLYISCVFAMKSGTSSRGLYKLCICLLLMWKLHLYCIPAISLAKTGCNIFFRCFPWHI